jgi:hypothetical protein
MTSADGLPTITTFTGRTFNYANPDTDSICIEDIAHALSFECRFANQSRTHYSVAQHSVLVQARVSRLGGDLGLAKIALLHDAAEAYVCDLPRPLKRMLPQYKEIEDRVHEAICKRFGLPSEIPQFVKDADNQLLAIEGISFMSKDWRDAGAPPTEEGTTIEAWSQAYAKLMFKEVFISLFGAGA